MRLYAPVWGKKTAGLFVPQKISFVSHATVGSFLELVRRYVSGQVPDDTPNVRYYVCV